MSSSMIYLYTKILKNRIKKALKKPTTYIAVVIGIGYLILMLWSFGMMAHDLGIDSPENFAMVLSILVFMIIPGDIISYTKRKGLVFKASDVHFIFPSPENPKQVLLFVSIRNYIILAAVGFFVSIFGVIYIGAAPWRMLLYFIFFAVLENILEGSMIIICYGNQTLPKGFFTALKWICYGLIAVLSIAAIVLLCLRGSHMSVIREYLTLPVVQLVPVIGWAIAFVHLLLIGPTAVNIVATMCYLITVVLLLIYARKMKCTGEYYEDAIKFAEEIALRQKKARKGEVSLSFGQKKYMKKASVTYKGVYAKAIFYRQLLEYKKNRFFIFGWNTLLSLIVGITIAVVAYFTDMTKEFGEGTVFVIPAVIAYIIMIFSGYATKWAKELENPYTYLVPDSGMKKLWYATQMEHIRSLVDGCLITIPGAIMMRLNPLVAILTIMVYVCLIANKLYLNMLADRILGKSLGDFGKSFLRMFLQMIVIGFGIVAAAIIGIILGVSAGFMGLIIVILLLTVAVAAIASTSFDRMESYD